LREQDRRLRVDIVKGVAKFCEVSSPAPFGLLRSRSCCALLRVVFRRSVYCWRDLMSGLAYLTAEEYFKTKRGDSGGQLDNCDDACCCSEYLHRAIAGWRDRRTKTSEACRLSLKRVLYSGIGNDPFEGVKNHRLKCHVNKVGRGRADFKQPRAAPKGGSAVTVRQI
jgi:hypothetical protein